MNKQEFLDQLKERLHVLNDEELEALIQEYDETINDAMADGKTEEEAVASFGDLEELVKELLDAYKLRQPYEKKTIDLAEEGKKAVEKLGSISLLSVTEWIIVAFALIVCYIVIHFARYMTEIIFMFLLNFFLNPWGVSGFMSFVFLIIEVVVDILLTIKVVKGVMGGLQMAEVFNLSYLFDLDQNEIHFDYLKSRKEKKMESMTEQEEPVTDDVKKRKRFQFKPREKDVREHKSVHFTSALWNLIQSVFKICVFLVVLPFLLMIFLILIIGVVFSAGSLVLSFVGYPLIGVSIGGIGGCVAIAAFIYLVDQFCKREDILLAGGIFLGGLVVCGIGAGIAFVEYTSLEVVYLNQEKIVSEESIAVPENELLRFGVDGYYYEIRYADVEQIEVSTYDVGYRSCKVEKTNELNYEFICEETYEGQNDSYNEVKEFLDNIRDRKIYVDNYHPTILIRLPHNADYAYESNGHGSILLGNRENIDTYIRSQESQYANGV